MSAPRTFWLFGHTPPEIIARASRFLAHLNRDEDNPQYATCCYLTLDPANGRVHACRAGHPRPILVSDAEPASLLPLDAGLPLGIEPNHHYSACTFTLTPGSTLLLYTDGLIERPGADIAVTTKETLRDLDDIGSAEPAAILAGLRPLNDSGPRFDDIAVLAARLTGR